jgi:hypothetical protein
MAENIVAGLFGLTPEMYGQQQQRSALNEGITLAQLDPAARGAALTYAGARGLGGAIAGAMGIEDPQLKMISARQQVLGQVDQSDPNSLLSGAKILAQMGDQQGAFALSDFARKAQVQIAEQQQRLAAGQASLAAAKRERAQADPFQKLVESGKYTPASLAEFQTSGKPADLVLYEKPEKPTKTSYGPEADRAAKGKFGKNFDELTQAEAAEIDKLLEDRGVKKAKEGAAQTNVNAYTPASVEAQKQFVQDVAKERSVLRTAPDTIKNIEAAKKLIPTASTFMGKGGEPLLAAASFLNNRLGFGISTQGVTDATVLRTRLFEGILDNLKKLDSQPSQEQQRVLSEALGNLGTDPAALEQILNRIADTVTDRVDRYNTDVTESEARGIKFPFKPQITLPQRPRAPGSAASQIPTQSAIPSNIPQKAIDALNRGEGTEAQFDAIFGSGAAKRVKGNK